MKKSKLKLNRLKALLILGLVIVAFLGIYWFLNFYNSNKEIVGAPATPVAQPKVEPGVSFSGEYQDIQNKFTITPPANWLMRNKNIGSAAVQFMNSAVDEDATGKFSANINVLVEATNLTVEDYAKASESTLGKLLTNYKLIDFKKMKFGALNGYIVGGTFENNGLALRNRQVFIVSKGNVYIATAISLASVWDKYVPDFKASLYGLRVQ